MISSLTEFKFVQSYRLPIEERDEVRFLVERPLRRRGHEEGGQYIDDAKLIDISKNGLGFSTQERLTVGEKFDVSIQFRKFHVDVSGTIVRSFINPDDPHSMIYGFSLDPDDDLSKFLEQFIQTFSAERLRDGIVKLALKERYSSVADGFEIFSLIISLFRDINRLSKKDDFVSSMLSEVSRTLNAQRASVFLINPDSNELEAVAALGADKSVLKFDYRLGVAGSVFTTGLALNIDVTKETSRFSNIFDVKTGFKTRSIICHPIYNREDKIIGVLEVLNKNDEERFTVEDEKIMKVLALVFSYVYHDYNPMSEISQVRRFSTPFDREYALIGKSKAVDGLRASILKLKDLDAPVLIEGGPGTGKALFAKILHYEGNRGLRHYEVVYCGGVSPAQLEEELFGPQSKLEKCKGGTLLVKDIHLMPFPVQEKLYKALLSRGIPGSSISLDVRILSTSRSGLDKMAHEGSFHKGLYSHISTSLVRIPPLRRRMEDLEDLVNFFLKVECKRQGLLLKVFSPGLLKTLKGHIWPGNVTELRKCVERAVLYNPKGHIITELDGHILPVLEANMTIPLLDEIPELADPRLQLKDRVALLEREIILTEVKKYDGNKTKAARIMGISREALRKKLMAAQEVIERLGPKEKVYDPELLLDEKAAA